VRWTGGRTGDLDAGATDLIEAVADVVEFWKVACENSVVSYEPPD
jgi:hypothetical protein